MTTEEQNQTSQSPTVELLRATAKGKFYRVIQAINDGAQLAVNKNGHSALHIASHKGFLDIVRILLSAGCDVDVQDDHGDTSLHRACISGHDLIVQRLIDEGCSVDRQNQFGDTSLHEAASKGYSRCVKALIEGRANIGLRNKNLDTAVHLACANCHSGSLRLLLSSYSHSSPRNAQGDTPLHIAVRFGHVTCARVLVSTQCNVDIQNKAGNSALHIATIARHHKLVRILLDAGASARFLFNAEIQSPLDIAKKNNDGETAIMLLSGPHGTRSCEKRERKVKEDGSSRRSRSKPRIQDAKEEINSQGSTSGGSRKIPFRRPKSDTLPRKRYTQVRAKWRRHERRKMERFEKPRDTLEEQQRQITVNPFVVPQLYSLYRDCHGDVRQKPVIDHLPNPTAEIVSSVTNAVVNCKGELLEEMRKTNRLLERRIDQLESSTEHKVAKLDLITRERIHAERMQCLHRIDRRAMLERKVLTSNLEGCECGSITETGHNAFENASKDLKKSCQQTGSNCDLICMPDEIKNSEIPGRVVREFCGPEPYRTVHLGSGFGSSTPHCGLGTMKKKSLMREARGCLDCSSSAYGSLSPRPAFDSFGYATSSPNLQEYSDIKSTLKSRPIDGINSPPRSSKKLGLKGFCEDKPAMATRVTQEFFENVTHAMEDWYEGPRREKTQKQQREMERKVAEVENKMKILRTSFAAEKGDQSSHNNKGGCV